MSEQGNMSASGIDDRARGPSGTEIADWIRDRIRKGRFVPGQRLVEIDIIRQTGASRSKVREALRLLEGEGLVQNEEFKGASVRSASIEEVRQIYRARIALEGIAAADFVTHASKEQFSRLCALHEELERCVSEGAPERFGKLNTEWHETLVLGSGNLAIADVLKRLSVPIHRLIFESFYSAERLKTAIADHRAILDAIASGEPAAAEAAMRKHIQDGFATLAYLDGEFHR